MGIKPGHIFLYHALAFVEPLQASLFACVAISRMRSFAAFTIFTVFAFLTLISALPSGTSSQDINVYYLHFLNYTILTMFKIAVESLPRDGGNQGIPDCINNANIQIGPLIKGLSKSCFILLHRTHHLFIVAATVNVDVSVFLPHAIEVMYEVEGILKATSHDITVILKDDPSNALCFNGVTVGVSVVVDLLTTLCKVNSRFGVLC